MTIAVFDIDGVVADVRHRVHFLEGRSKNWPGFFRGAHADPLLTEGKALVTDLATKHDIVWLTGRPDWLRRVTSDWLESHDLPIAELHMRSEYDFRPAPQLKLDVLRKLQHRDVAAFIDDDTAVIDAALAANFPAILADWVPRGGALKDAQDKLGRT
jgi:phosphoglycolate phosphatase-like HAD superfamily hydrolase